jgi:hypothetical protein
MHRRMLSSPPLPSVAGAALFLLAACGRPDQLATAPVDRVSTQAFAKGATAISLGVTVADAPNRIQSDGKGEYVDGQQGVIAQIDTYGNLLFNSPVASNAVRTVTFDYSAPVDPNNTYRPDETGQVSFRFLTQGTTGVPGISSLGVNGNPSSGCYHATLSHMTAATGFTDWFNPAAYPGSITAYITRTSISPATWTMVSNGPCGGTANIAALQSQDRTTRNAKNVDRGYYNQQFSFTFRAL